MERTTIPFSVKTCLIISLLLLLSTTSLTSGGTQERDHDNEKRNSLVFLAIIARNAAHLLPDYLGFLERLNYPKKNIAVQ